MTLLLLLAGVGVTTPAPTPTVTPEAASISPLRLQQGPWTPVHRRPRFVRYEAEPASATFAAEVDLGLITPQGASVADATGATAATLSLYLGMPGKAGSATGMTYGRSSMMTAREEALRAELTALMRRQVADLRDEIMLGLI